MLRHKPHTNVKHIFITWEVFVNTLPQAGLDLLQTWAIQVVRGPVELRHCMDDGWTAMRTS
jgi:hypothetical protein